MRPGEIIIMENIAIWLIGGSIGLLIAIASFIKDMMNQEEIK